MLLRFDMFHLFGFAFEGFEFIEDKQWDPTGDESQSTEQSLPSVTWKL